MISQSSYSSRSGGHTIPRSLPMVGVVIGLILTSLGLAMGLLSIRDQKDVRNQAAGNNDVAMNVSFETENENYNGKAASKVKLFINTANYTIAGTQVVGSITGVTPDRVTVVGETALPLETVIGKVSAISGGTKFVLSQFASVDKSKPVNNNGQAQQFAVLHVIGDPGSSFSFSFDPANSSFPVVGGQTVTTNYAGARTIQIQTASNNNNNSGSTSSTPGDKKSCDQNCATDTECQSQLVCYKGRCRAPTKLEDASCVANGNQGLNRSCNQYCADTRECANGLTCYYNQCRNPKNLTNATCQLPAKPKVVTTVQKGTSVASPSATPILSETLRVAASPSPSASVSPSPSFIPTSTPFPTITPSPTIRPIPAAVVQKKNNTPLIIAIIVALIIVIPGGFLVYRRFAA